jgi:hypothetical protein
MKKLLVLALLIASVTFIFAVESDYSDVVGYVKYELNSTDFNMIAIPMDTGITTAAELAAAISPEVTSITKWDGGWAQYSTSSPATSFDVFPGESFLVYLGGETSVDFYCAGTLPNQANYDFTSSDFNQIMLPLNRSDITTAAELAASIGAGVTSITTWDGGWVQYSTSSPATSFDINLGDGFLVYSTEAYTAWNAPAARNITTKRASARK